VQTSDFRVEWSMSRGSTSTLDASPARRLYTTGIRATRRLVSPITRFLLSCSSDRQIRINPSKFNPHISSRTNFVLKETCYFRSASIIIHPTHSLCIQPQPSHQRTYSRDSTNSSFSISTVINSVL
jgi:hypothetical protein